MNTFCFVLVCVVAVFAVGSIIHYCKPSESGGGE